MPLHGPISLSSVIALFVVEMSSKKKRKRSCPFSSAKKAPQRKTSKVFHKEWAEALESGAILQNIIILGIVTTTAAPVVLIVSVTTVNAFA